MTKYKYLSVSQKWLNTIYKYKFCWASQMEGLQDQFWVSQGDAKFVEPSDDWSWLQMQTAPNPYDSPNVALVYEDDICSFGAQSSFGSAEYSKKNTHPLIFSED